MKGCTSICVVLLMSATASAKDADPSKAVIRRLHAQTITPASDALFAAESKAPSTPGEWSRLEANAKALAQAAEQLRSLPGATNERKWQVLAARLIDHAKSAARAANRKNVDELVAANGNVIAACEGCHDDYRDGGNGMTSDK